MDKKILNLINNSWKQAQSRDYKCFFPDCNKKAIQSHSQSKEAALRYIAEDGRVVKPLKHPLNKYSNVDDCYEEIGINKASTFQGFCNEHDGNLFREIDNLSDSELTVENLVKLSFRTFANEVRAKQRIAYFSEKVCAKIETENPFYDGYLGVKNNLTVTTPHYQKIFTDLLEGKSDKIVKGVIFESSSLLPASTSTTFNPDIFSEENIEWPLDKPLITSFLNVIPQEMGGLLIFSFFSEHEKDVEEFIRINANFENVIFNYCEELLLKPSFFFGLSDQEKIDILSAQKGWSTWKKQQFNTLFEVKVERRIDI